LAEGACELCHGLGQAFQKRDLPRSLLFDNGSAMIAAETEQGLARLGVLYENTLPFSPYQNGKAGRNNNLSNYLAGRMT
jgi:transposase InsO family protein